MKEYAVVHEQAGNNFSAYVPNLPGCIAAGETLAETKQLIREAINLHVASIRNDGEAIPESSTFVDSVAIAA